jgi:GTP pyrophosphokinase
MPASLQHPLTHRFDEALRLAADVHRNQGRKGTQVPYLAHILGVTSIALEYGADEDEAIGAVLHDSLEDAPEELGAEALRRVIRLKFGHRVLDVVEACTDAESGSKPAWRTRKEAYVASIPHKTASALLVGTADKVYNVRAILTDFREIGNAVFDRFNPEAGKAGTLWYYGELAVRIAARSAELRDARVERLATELTRVVAILRSEADA